MAARRHLSFANVTASIALFVALGGTGYAAAKVRSRDIVNGAVTSSKLAGNAVTGAKVRDGSLAAADFAPGQLPPGLGAPGPAGRRRCAGPRGPPGLGARLRDRSVPTARPRGRRASPTSIARSTTPAPSASRSTGSTPRRWS